MKTKPLLPIITLVLLALVAAWYIEPSLLGRHFSPRNTPHSELNHGKLVKVESVQTFTPEQAMSVSHRNYALGTPKTTRTITKAIISYTSLGADNVEIKEYARIYMPTKGRNLPIFAFAPGTTGIGDQCAASLEQPATKNWADYESHMVTYAGQGYATVTTDYEGMRDPQRMHHYMVGELEGRAVLDSIVALRQWDGAKGRLDESRLFIGGFSQGGHSAMWADKIARDYTPDLTILGVVGFGPVMDVERTLADVTHSANINWFGPFVLTSYLDYYASNYDLSKILLPRWSTNLSAEVNAHCIDSLIPHFGKQPQGVYTPEFIQALANNSLAESGYASLASDLQRNGVGDQATRSAKLINQGALDNVVLPAQQQYILPKLCANSRGSVNLKLYPTATHYNVMVQSFHDTFNWMQAVSRNQAPKSTCS